MAAGEAKTITVCPRGESGVRISFDAHGRHVDAGEQGYFECAGYRVDAKILPDLTVSVSSKTQAF
jgi:hypothetical protein